MITLAYAIGAIIILGYSAAVATRRLPEREDAALPGRPLEQADDEDVRRWRRLFQSPPRL
jgi:hypothetical protein